MRIKRVVKWSAGILPPALAVLFLVAWFRSDNVCSAPPAPAGGALMRAVIQCEYGTAEVLELRDVPKPVPGDSQVLVRVHVAAVNALDWHGMRGEPYIARAVMGLRKPRDVRIGVDFAGTVEAVGSAVTRFRPGDAVFGARTGAFAEYVTLSERATIAKIPVGVAFEQAAALPVAAGTALEAVRNVARVQPGQRVLINGASGGVGTFAVQLAHALGAEVTGVASTRNLEMVRTLGAQHVIDYTREDFTTRPERYDVVIDIVGNRTLGDFRSVLRPGGKYVLVGAGTGRWADPFPRIVGMKLLAPFVKQEMRFFISDPEQEELTWLAEQVRAGTLTPMIDRTYPLSEIRAAVGYVDEGHARAKVLVAID